MTWISDLNGLSYKSCAIFCPVSKYTKAEKTYIGNQKKVGMRIMAKLHEQGKYRWLFERIFWCNNRKTEDEKC